MYEAKRAEAAKTLDETAAKRESIKGVLQAIDSRLQELEGEKEELQRARTTRSRAPRVAVRPA